MRLRCLVTLWIVVSLSAVLTAAQQDITDVDPAHVEHFEAKVRPLLLERCGNCHSEDSQEGSLRLDNAEGFSQGGKSGPVVVAGEPDSSLLIRAVRRVGKVKMPPDEKDRLTSEEIQELVKWVQQGAVWPSYQEVPWDGGTQFTDEQKSFWSFQPIQDPPLPDVQRSGWPKSPIDRFVLAHLEHAGLQPAPTAEKHTWLRRVTLDMIGLPPKVRELDAFLADEAPDAKSRIVDRLLASPHYGERWLRHWLDVARYSDTLGQEADWVLRYAWRYRDYVVSAFNNEYWK